MHAIQRQSCFLFTSTTNRSQRWGALSLWATFSSKLELNDSNNVNRHATSLRMRKCFAQFAAEFHVCSSRLKKKNMLTDALIAPHQERTQPKCLLLDVDGKRLGVFEIRAARFQAEQRQLRVGKLDELEGALEIPESVRDASHPVYQLFTSTDLHDMQMKARDFKRQQKVVHNKIVQFTSKMADNDANTKITRVIDFAIKGDRVHCVIGYREGESSMADGLLKRIVKDVKARAVTIQNIQRTKSEIKFQAFKTEDLADRSSRANSRTTVPQENDQQQQQQATPDAADSDAAEPKLGSVQSSTT